MAALDGSSTPPPGWGEGETGATYVPPAPPPLPASHSLRPIAPLGPGELTADGQPKASPADLFVSAFAPTPAPAVAGAPSLAPAPGFYEPRLTPEQAIVPPRPLLAHGQPAAEAAVRWRVRAATVDNLLVYAAYLLLCAALHWSPLNVGHIVVLLALGVVYHFALESMGGQTIGKRRYGIQVVSVHGGPASPKAIALRSILRFIDALPFGYFSGLISMVRTGPERRQRIGDVAGETKVIAISGRAAARGTPGWLLPAATILSLAYSCLGVYGIAEAGRQPLTSSQQAQFISGCENSAGGQAIDCQCFLNRLEADGYNTPNSITSLVQGAANERLLGQHGPARTELTAAAVACAR